VVKPRHRKRDNRKFYMTLGTVAIIGAAMVGYAATRPSNAAVTRVDPSIPVGAAEGYVMGSATAPVEIIEFADFECPACGQFAIVTEPQVRELLVQTGKARIRFFDFPLDIHQNTMPAHLAAACANDQGKFWEMHDQLFAGQDKWNTQATSNPKKVFVGYVRALGLDADAWETCYDEDRHRGRIVASVAEGNRRRIRSTPTFIVGGSMVPGALGYDKLKAMVDSASAAAPATAPAPTPPAPAAAKRP
jgi:protein-disulfide isomerase